MRIASWNVNSVRARLHNILDWLSNLEIDVILIQEIKCVEEQFPRLEFEALGYEAAINGQKSYNGVAILSKSPITEVKNGLPNYLEDERFDPSTMLEDANWNDSNASSLHLAVKELDERSRDILQQRWLSDDKATLHELAAEYGVSAERIRQLEKNAMKKIRTMMEA